MERHLLRSIMRPMMMVAIAQCGDLNPGHRKEGKSDGKKTDTLTMGLRAIITARKMQRVIARDQNISPVKGACQAKRASINIAQLKAASLRCCVKLIFGVPEQSARSIFWWWGW